MSFKVKLKKSDTTVVELTIDEIEQTTAGLVLTGLGDDSKTYRFIWLALDPSMTVPPTTHVG